MDSKEIWPSVLERLRTHVAGQWDIEGFSATIGVAPQTLGEWLANVSPPVGERLIRLWHFLAAVGYDSPELNRVEPFNRYLGQLLAMSVITMNDVQELLNVKNAQTALQILRGSKPMHPLVNLAELKQEYDSVLSAKLAELPARNKGQPKQRQAQPARTEKPSASSSQVVTSKGSVYALDAATMLSGALPLCRWLNSDSCTPEERSRFRDLMGSEALFELSNTTGSLCSERARNNAR